MSLQKLDLGNGGGRLNVVRMLLLRERRWMFRLRAPGVESLARIVAIPPCYYVADGLSDSSVVVDCGTGPDAEFSRAIVDRFGSRCYGLDPTRRHHPALERLVAASNGRFTFVARAVAARSGRMSFHESRDNVSGSVLTDHLNVRQDETVTYDVEAVSIADLFALLGVQWIDVLKLDIEGAEYEALTAASDDVLGRIGQLVIEFHDHCVPRYSPGDTRRLIRRLRTVGFSAYSRDGINCLFFRPPNVSKFFV